MSEEQKNLISNAIKVKKKRTVNFSLQNDYIKQANIPCQLKKQSSEPRFRGILYTAPRKVRHIRGCSNTDRVLKRDSLIQQDQLKVTLNDIQQRGSNFFKIGFLSTEKKGKRRKVLADFFNLKHQQMKGTMSIGQLWSGKERSNFLKQNKININKVKLIEKINIFRKQHESLTKKIQSQNSIYSAYSQSLAASAPGTTRTLTDSQAKKENLQKDLFQLRRKAARLQRQKSKQEINSMFRSLQCHSQNMGKLEQKYFLKLIDMI